MRSSYARHVGHRIVVQIGEDTIGGILREASRRVLILADAASMTRQIVAMDGEVVIPTDAIRWMQVLP